jgi:hypothetical protein
VTPISAQPYARNNYGGTIGGPLIIPGLYKDTNRRSSFQLNYSGNHSTSLQDQYLTVPSMAMRNGDFSKSTIQLVNPATGQPFLNNQIPMDQRSATALALMGYIPEPNIPGAITQNFHTAATTLTSSNSVSMRINQNLTPTLPQRGGGPGGRGGGGGGRGGGAPGGGGPGRGGRGLTINLSAQLQYRENTGEQFNVIPQLASKTKATSVTVPINLTVAKGRTNNTFAVNVASNSSTDVESVFEHGGRGRARRHLVSVGAEPVELGRAEPDVLQLQRATQPANSRDDLRTSVSYTLSRPVRTTSFASALNSGATRRRVRATEMLAARLRSPGCTRATAD